MKKEMKTLQCEECGYIGYYGFQEGDNNATISREKQEEETVNIIDKFLESI